ncbi:insulinase family protein [Shewanella sedimentimangrovi]|uniref:Insulinase family protein n=1 Tax=Shewanella sedimentimangrovi TaxID=2814293 RepID=A0ABX7QYD9_9GAMM|nr:insulinase family protein [Shewanella sedimentimangrovi]QSX36543.1 insulinase family protein [Shewanella sedimentimangrovi]
MKFWMISLLALTLCGCQQTREQYTEVMPPQLLTPVQPPMQVQVPPPPPLTVASQQLASSVYGHWREQGAGPEQTRLQLVLLQTGAIDGAQWLAAALQQQLRALALDSADACYESIAVQYSLHSLVLEANCPERSDLGLGPMISAWQQLPRDFERLSRSVRLQKHIEAFSGRDIERLWRQAVLGQSHPYLRALEQEAPKDEGELARWRQHALAGGSWHLLTGAAAHLPSASSPLVAALGKLSGNKPRQDTAKAGLLPDNSHKRILLLDSPGAVQSQIRLGYALAPEGDSRNCELLAALLGRGGSGRLYLDLREQRGLTYGVYGSCIDNPLSRSLKFQGATATLSTGAFVRGIVDHLALLAAKGSTEAELRRAEGFLNGREWLWQDAPGGWQTRYRQQLERGRSNGHAPRDLMQFNSDNAALLALTPIIVIKGDAARIEADLRQALPDFQLQRAE